MTMQTWKLMMGLALALVLLLVVKETEAYSTGPRPMENSEKLNTVPFKTHKVQDRLRQGKSRLPPLSFNSTASYLRVLALDGGGIRGLLSSRILVALEKKIQSRTDNPKAKIGDFFDVISGTSTGGIMALALMSGYNASQITDIWYSNAETIFGSAMKQWLGPAIDSAYNPLGLEKVLKTYLGNSSMVASFSNKSYAIVSFDSGFIAPAVFTRQSVVENGDFLTWQVGRATSAAPTYFPTAYISSFSGKNFTFIDGGMMANDPALIALAVAGDDYPKVEMTNKVLLSVGTGIMDTSVSGYRDWGYEKWATSGNLLNLVFDGPTYGIEDSLSRLFDQAGIPSQYLRVQYNQNIGIDGTLLSNCQKADFGLDVVSPKNLNLLVLCGDQIAAAYSSYLDDIARYLTSVPPS